MKKSNIFIISGPSGAGEDSIIKGLEKIISFEKIITTTTREMRPGESQGDPYYFISRKEFEEGVNNNKFYEYAEEDRSNWYGITKKEFERALGSGKPVILKVDYQGTVTAKRVFSNVIAILIDITPETIEKRIRKRDNASDEYIKGRLKHAQGWYDNRDKFDYAVKNEEGKLEEAIQEVAEIIKKHSPC